MKEKKPKKIKDLKGFGLKAFQIQGNRVKPGNDFIPFKKEEINQFIPKRFEAIVKKYPDKIAVKFGTQQVTYDTLNQKANQVAQYVLSSCEAENPGKGAAALLFGQDTDMISGIMGVLKTGMFYVPLDTSYPEDRLEYMLEDSEARVIVTNQNNFKLALKLTDKVNKNIVVINMNDIPVEISVRNPNVNIDPGDLAYILYTSGSTGKPKGVMQNHRNVLHHARVYTNALHINDQDHLTLFSSYSFDAAKMDIYGALLNGATLYPYDIKAGDNLQRLPRWLWEEGITIYHSISTIYRYFTDLLAELEVEPGRFLRLRLVVLGGEAVFKKDVDNYKKYFSNHCIFINGLGPTESTVTLQYFIDKNTEITREAVPVGFPVEETQVLLLTEYNREAGLLGVGEILFKSDYLALGYWKNPELTREVFTSDPLTGEGRVYRSGDLGRRLADGSIEYAGRKDFQVKISGYRIEPGEIESRLDQVTGIKKCIVVCSQDDSGDNFLTAYYTQTNKGQVDENPLVKILKNSLPDYMIPSVFIDLPEFPLTPTGKIDRKKLAQQDMYKMLPRVELKAPGNETQSHLLKLWKEVLKQETMGVNQNFFLLGGNSIKAILLVSRVHKEMKVKISLVDIFQRPTIKELAAAIDTAQKRIYQDIIPAEKREYYPLSSAQERLFFLNQFEEESTRFNIFVALSIRGRLEIRWYQSILEALIQRHESLRTSFTTVNDTPVQRVHDQVEFEMEYYDIKVVKVKTEEERPPVLEGTRGLATLPKESAANIIKHFIRPYDLASAPLIRVGVFSLSPQEHYLLFDIHHIIFDGTSMQILVEDFIHMVQKEKPDPLEIQYKDFALWQKNLFKTGMIEKQEDYWLSLYSDGIEGKIPRVNLPTDYPRPDIMSYEGDNYRFFLDKEKSNQLKKMAAAGDISLFILVLAMYNVFLSKLSQQEDIIVASVTSGRNHPDIESVLGVFINMLSLRNFPRKEKTFAQFLAEVGKSSLQAFENLDYPFEELVEKVPGSRDVSRHPLVDVGFTLQNIEIIQDQSYHSGESQLRLISLKSERKNARNDLNLEGFEINDHLEFEFQFRTKLFKKQTIIRLAGYFQNLMTKILENPWQKIGDIQLITDREKELLLVEFNNTTREYPANQLVFQLFEHQVEQNPENIALVSTIQLQNIYDRLEPEDVAVEVSYEELNERANQLAHMLSQKGIGPDSIVGLMVEHPIEKAVGIWGTMKSAGAYLPIDPLYPHAVIKDILKDSQVRLLVTETGLEEILTEIEPARSVSIMFIDEMEADYDIANPGFINNPSDLAYIIYTSGTTGKAKGTAIEHKGIVNYARWRLDYFNFTGEDVALQPLTYSFDSFCANFYPAFLSGGKLGMVPDNRRLDFAYIVELIKEHRVTNVCFAPGLYNALLDAAKEEDLKSFRLVVLAGEASSPALIKKSREKAPHIWLANEYGPTEATVAATVYPKIEETLTGIIGTPIANARIYILDESLQPIIPGAAGEICISGTGIARGYLNNPELTAKKFDHDFKDYLDYHDGDYRFYRSNRTYIKLYKTGDLARWQPDGNIEFLGRKDHQVKLRGHRIELEQIESLLMKHRKIKEVLVAVKGEEDNRYICAYIVPSDPGTFYTADIKDYLNECLPYYMVPSHLVRLEKFPLTPNGKIDRNALPDPGFTPEDEYIAPRNQMEKSLVKIWAEVLNLKKEVIGIDSNFFHLGGHSLRAIMLAAKIQKEFDFKVPLTHFFDSPTIRGFAGFINTAANRKDLIDKSEFKPIEPAEKREYYPVSSQQKRLYALQQFKKGSTAYNVPAAFILKGNVDVGKLESILKKLIEKHEAFRTSFQLVEGEPVQRINDGKDIQLGYEEVTSKEMGSEVRKFIKAFDLSRWPMIRMKILKLEEKEYLMLVDMHHITADALSIKILVNDVAAAYEEKKLKPLNIQYKDYSVWQNKGREEPEIKKQEEYWLKRYEVEIPVLNLPTDYPRPLKQSFAGSRCVSRWDEEFSQTVNRLCRTYDVTLFMLLLACYQVLLSRYSSQTDVSVGTPVSGRNHADLEGIIGMFTNTLVIRSQPEPGKSFLHYLTEIKQITLESFDNQGYPFEDMVEKLKVKRDMSRNPLFDIMFVMQNEETDRFRMGDIEIGFYPREYTTSKFDLTLMVSEDDNKTVCVLEYCASLFKPETIDRLCIHFRQVVKEILTDPLKKISQIDILTDKDRETLLYEFNNTRVQYPEEHTIHELFERQVEITPDNVALVFQEERMTYKELNRISNRLAKMIRGKGTKADVIVGIMINRSIQMITAILAVVKAGGAYLPIDPDSPVERIKYMLEDCGAKLLLNQPSPAPSMTFAGEIIDVEQKPGNQWDGNNPGSINCPKDLVYVIYTSGSTGKPKGVMMTHRNVVNLVYALREKIYNYKEPVNTALVSPFMFDASIKQVFPALLCGHRLIIVPEEKRFDGEKLIKYYKEKNILISDGTPTHLAILMNYKTQLRNNFPIRKFAIGGEALELGLIKQLLDILAGDDFEIINVYGPTECCDVSSLYTVTKKPLKEIRQIPIGKPINNVKLYVLGRNMELQAIGVPGELHISGDGVGRGYLNDPELTAEKFDHDFKDYRDYHDGYHRSYQSYRPYIHYKTGDLAKWQSNGDIEFLGRIDHQVKIRGFRIEIGEIETRLLAHQEVKEAVVIPLEKEGDKYLCAYIVTRNAEAFKKTSSISTDLREFLSAWLPDYMIPSYFITLEAIPLTFNGKVDRRVLGDLQPGIESAPVYEAPTTEMETMLAEMWQKILDRERIGINENFFALGGHSLKAIQLVSLLEKENIEINVGDIFRYSNIKSLAKNIIQPRIKNKTNLDIKYKQETLLIDNIPGEEKEKILNRLQHSIKAFNEAILKENVFKCCPLSAIQKSHLKLSNRSSGGIMALNGYPEQEKLHDSIIKVIKCQGLLRSRLVKEGERLLWSQHEMPEDLNLPFIDLSGYTIEIQDELTHMIVSRYFPNREIDVTILPYSIILIKKNAKDYLLIFSADHTVYDAMSNQVVRSDIHSFYYGKEETDTARLNCRNYDEYVKQINKGPQHVEEEKIIEVFQLNDFKDSIARVNRMFKEYRSDRYVTHEINLNYKDIFTSSPPGENLSLEISLNIYALLCRALFRIHKVPLLFFSLGRKYEDKSFFNTVGEFIDLVPIMVDTDNDITNITVKIEEKIAFASTHNINFMTTVLNKEISKKWNRVTRMLSPKGVDYDKNLLRFNFIGKTDNIPLEKEIVKIEDPGESTKRYDVELEGATFWSSFNKDVLKIAVGINMQINPREFCEKLNSIARQVINKYKE